MKPFEKICNHYFLGKERLPVKLLVEKTDRAISEYSKILQKVLKERKILILKMKLMNIQIQLKKLSTNM